MSLDAHAQAVLAHLRAGDIIVGDNNHPDEPIRWQGAPGQSPFITYAILFAPLGAEDRRGWSLAGGFDDWRPQMFIRCYGESATSARKQLDAVDARMLDGGLEIPGFRVKRVIPGTSTTMSPNDSAETRDHEAGRYYRFRTEPLGV